MCISAEQNTDLPFQSVGWRGVEGRGEEGGCRISSSCSSKMAVWK